MLCPPPHQGAGFLLLPTPCWVRLVLVIINTVKGGQLTVVNQEQVTDLDQSSVCMTSCGSMLPGPYRPVIGNYQ